MSDKGVGRATLSPKALEEGLLPASQQSGYWHAVVLLSL